MDDESMEKEPIRDSNNPWGNEIELYMYGEKLKYSQMILYLGVKLNDQAVNGIISEIHTALRFEKRLEEKIDFIINKMVLKYFDVPLQAQSRLTKAFSAPISKSMDNCCQWTD